MKPAGATQSVPRSSWRGPRSSSSWRGARAVARLSLGATRLRPLGSAVGGRPVRLGAVADLARLRVWLRAGVALCGVGARQHVRLVRRLPVRSWTNHQGKYSVGTVNLSQSSERRRRQKARICLRGRHLQDCSGLQLAHFRLYDGAELREEASKVRQLRIAFLFIESRQEAAIESHRGQACLSAFQVATESGLRS